MAIHGPVLNQLLEDLLNLVQVATSYKNLFYTVNYPIFEKITPLHSEPVTSFCTTGTL